MNHTGILTTKTTGTTNIQAVVSPVMGSASLTVVVPPHSLLKNAGLYVQFERRGWPTEYWSGEVIQNWDRFDSTVGSTVSSEVFERGFGRAAEAILEFASNAAVDLIVLGVRKMDPIIAAYCRTLPKGRYCLRDRQSRPVPGTDSSVTWSGICPLVVCS